MFKARVPKNSYFKKVSVFGYYFYYMGFFSIIQILSSTGYLLGNISCMLNASIANSMVKITITFGAIQSIILSFVLMGLRFSHPLLKMKIRKLLNKRRNQFDPEEESINDRPWLGSLL
jgi:hypothetical protein